MPPAIIDAANAHRAALLAREQATMQAMARRWLGVEQSLNTATEVLAHQMANGDEPVTVSQLMRSQRYQELRRQLNAELRRYNAYADETITNGQRNMITDALTHSQALITAAALEAQMAVQFNRLPVSTVERMVGLAGDGSPLMSVLNDATAGAGDALAQRLVSGVALGQNPIEVARQAIRNGVGQSFTRIATIGRTEMLRAYRVTTLEQYQASRVVTAYRRLSARDERTCPACLFADGQVYELGESFDQHPNCRCTLTPILRNVPPVQYETGQQWFTRQPEGTQLAILGRGRYDLWRRGEASLDDMISRDWSDTWGGSLRVTSVGDLRSGRGRVWAGGGPGAPTPVLRIPEWQPSMSRADAELWAANSAYKGDTYHVTPGVANERSIKENGFDLSKRKFGRMWGDGVYVGTDETTAEQYRGWTGQSARTLTIKVDVRNPAIFNANGRTFSQHHIVSEVLGIDEKAAKSLGYDKATRSLVDLSTILKNHGYDALDIRGAHSAAGGNQMVIFDPKKVVVIND